MGATEDIDKSDRNVGVQTVVVCVTVVPSGRELVIVVILMCTLMMNGRARCENPYMVGTVEPETDKFTE